MERWSSSSYPLSSLPSSSYHSPHPIYHHINRHHPCHHRCFRKEVAECAVAGVIERPVQGRVGRFSFYFLFCLLVLCLLVFVCLHLLCMFLAALAALYLPLWWVTDCRFRIWTHRVTVDPWDPSDIWSAWSLEKMTKRHEVKMTKRQKDNMTKRQNDKKTKKRQKDKRTKTKKRD